MIHPKEKKRIFKKYNNIKKIKKYAYTRTQEKRNEKLTIVKFLPMENG
jgi:hypothetical protein